MTGSIFDSRAELTRDQIRRELEARLITLRDETLVDPDDGTITSLDGVQVVTNATLLEVFAMRLPDPPEHSAEVVTPAKIQVAGICPNCHLTGKLTVSLSVELRMDETGSALALKAKSKPTNHVCGQLPLDVPDDVADGQEALPFDEDAEPEPLQLTPGDVDAQLPGPDESSRVDADELELGRPGGVLYDAETMVGDVGDPVEQSEYDAETMVGDEPDVLPGEAAVAPAKPKRVRNRKRA